VKQEQNRQTVELGPYVQVTQQAHKTIMATNEMTNIASISICQDSSFLNTTFIQYKPRNNKLF